MNKDMNRDEAMAYMAAHPGVITCRVGRSDIMCYYKWEYGWLLESRDLLKWEQICHLAFRTYQPYTPKPAHKALCWAWFDNWERRRNAVFYNAKYDRAYTAYKYDGPNDGTKYDHYKEIPRVQWPAWAIEQYDKLED